MSREISDPYADTKPLRGFRMLHAFMFVRPKKNTVVILLAVPRKDPSDNDNSDNDDHFFEWFSPDLYSFSWIAKCFAIIFLDKINDYKIICVANFLKLY